MEWPIYKTELLTLGNPESSTGLCTLWTEKEKVLKHISPENYLIAGNCYSKSEGISLIIRHALANKRLSQIVLCGADLNNTGEALLTLVESKKGIDSNRKIYGFDDSEIESEIPLEAIDRFRENVDIIDWRDRQNRKDYSSLDDFLSSLPQKEPWGPPEIFDRPAPKPSKTYPSEETGFIVREKKVGDAWLKILATILRFGHLKKSQYSDDQKEITCLTSVISDEDPDDIDWKPYFTFTREHFEDYLPQLMSSAVVGDVSYTYGSRLRNFKGINQIDSMVDQLKQAIHSRRAVGVTWDVEQDHNNSHSPCLDLIQALAQDKLHMTAYIRSNDMFRAWPENALALRKVHYEIADKVDVEPGHLIIISNSAHLYAPTWKFAEKILENYPVKLKREPDPRGNIVIELEKSQIKITHLTPEGSRIGEFHAETAKQAYKQIVETQMISQVSHALDIGVELGKAEIALNQGINYIQDKPLMIK
ncbi:DUF4346 domain-containing protein [Candidatus Woesearchaeota archaeon]|nr:DUF4346 domain-containing protein [Candidatus Woesearchaeota archaeon]